MRFVGDVSHLKRTAILFGLIFTLLLFVAVNLHLVENASANGYVFGMMPRTYIHSPENRTYLSDSVPVDVTFEISQRVYDNSSNPTVIQLDNAGYKMNGWSTIPAEYVSENDTWVIFHGETILGNLSEGSHEVRLYCSASTLGSIYDTVAFFTIEAHAPTVSVHSPENKTYQINAFPLNVTANEDVVQIRYSLDGKENVTAAGNTTLQDLQNGSHGVTVYAVNKVGNIGTSETVAFTVDMPESNSQLEPFPWVFLKVTVAVVAILFGIAALIVLWRRNVPKVEHAVP